MNLLMAYLRIRGNGAGLLFPFQDDRSFPVPCLQDWLHRILTVVGVQKYFSTHSFCIQTHRSYDSGCLLFHSWPFNSSSGSLEKTAVISQLSVLDQLISWRSHSVTAVSKFCILAVFPHCLSFSMNLLCPAQEKSGFCLVASSSLRNWYSAHCLGGAQPFSSCPVAVAGSLRLLHPYWLPSPHLCWFGLCLRTACGFAVGHVLQGKQ